MHVGQEVVREVVPHALMFHISYCLFGRVHYHSLSRSPCQDAF